MQRALAVAARSFASTVRGLIEPYTWLSVRQRFLIALAWYAFVFILSHSPGTDVDSTSRALAWFSLEDLNSLFRLSAHLGVFGLQALLVLGALVPRLGMTRTALLVAVAVTALLGLGDEIHQSFVPKRHGRFVDAWFDTVGAMMAVTVAWLISDWGRED